MPKVTEEHLQTRRKQILLAAYKCFGNKGFHRTTMRDISREAGLSLGGIYVHFESKNAIVEALAAMGRETTRSMLQATPRRRHPPAALADLMRFMLEQLEECQDATRIDVRLWAESLERPLLRRLFSQGFETACEPFGANVYPKYKKWRRKP